MEPEKPQEQPSQSDLEKLIAPEIFDKIKQMGIQSLYPPQINAIWEGLKGENLFVSIPTAAGKTLIAVVLIMNHFLKHKAQRSTHKILYLTPLKALAREKFQEFTQNWGHLGIKVKKAVSDPDKDESYVFNADLIIMTNEKADSMLRAKPELMQAVSMIVCDEIHLMNDQSRGATLEMLLTRIKTEQPKAQIIGLSATVSNHIQLSKWLGANAIKDEYRPIKVRYMYYIPHELHELRREEENEIIDKIYKRVPSIVEIDPSKKADKSNLLNSMVELSLDIMEAGGQCLIFTNSRKSAMQYAQKIGEFVKIKLHDDEDLKKERDQISTEFLNLSSDLTDLAKMEAECIRKGVVFHHAGLVEDQQRKIEDAFKKRKVKVIVATPTLAAGVNVPARRVIIQSTTRFDEESGRQVAIPIMEFQQMAGRAGRPGYDPYGEVVVLSNNYDMIRTMSERYYFSPSEKIISKLSEKSQFETHVLGAIASKIAKTETDLVNFFKNSFYFYQNIDSETKYWIPSLDEIKFSTHKMKKGKKMDIERARDEIKKRKMMLAKKNVGRGRDPLKKYDDFIAASDLLDDEEDNNKNETPIILSDEQSGSEMVQEDITYLQKDLKSVITQTLDALEENSLIERQDNDLFPTEFGKIAFQMYIKPEIAQILMENIIKTKKYHDSGELTYHPSTWLYIMCLTGEFKNTPPSKNLMNYIILNYERYQNYLPISSFPNELDYNFADFATNLKVLMVLEDWMNEVPEAQITDRYDIHSGDLNYFINIGCWLTRCMLRFSEAFGFSDIQAELKNFEQRVKAGIKEELLPLITIKGIGRKRARLLFNAGFKTSMDILNANEQQLKQIAGFSTKLIDNIKQEIIKKGTKKTAVKGSKQNTQKRSMNSNKDPKISEERYSSEDPDGEKEENDRLGKDLPINENENENPAAKQNGKMEQNTENRKMNNNTTKNQKDTNEKLETRTKNLKKEKKSGSLFDFF